MGRDANLPKLTCKNSSTVDYILTTAHNFELFSSFCILEFDHLYSDFHCPLTLELKIQNTITELQPDNKARHCKHRVKLWDENKSNDFTENIDFDEISRINSFLEELS